MPQFLNHHYHNFGYGRSLSYAGHNALTDFMAGQFNSIASHSERWKQFCLWAKTQGINEAHQINSTTVKAYADYLRARLEGQGKPLSVSTAQNRLSSCNVVLKALRGNDDIRIKPAEALQAKRQKVRTEPPELSREKLACVQNALCGQGHERVAVVVGLCRELGLRSREAVLLDCKKALQQAQELGRIDIERGTKGGRGKATKSSPSRAERWVPVSATANDMLCQGVRLQSGRDNLIPSGMKLVTFMALVRVYSGPLLKQYGLNNRHDLRAAYACEQYQKLTGCPAPVISRAAVVDKSKDRQAREEIGHQLGHNRIDVVASYLGSNKA